MDRRLLLEHVQRLGHEFSRRGMGAHLRKLRLYWLALRRGLDSAPTHEVDLKWNEPLVLDWLRTLRVPPFEHDFPSRPRGSACARCPPTGQQSGVFTAANFPGGTRMRCHRCGLIWLELD